MMKELKAVQETKIFGGKLINGGYSGHPGWPTSAIKANPRKQKRAKAAACVSASYGATKIPHAGASKSAGAIVALFCGR